MPRSDTLTPENLGRIFKAYDVRGLVPDQVDEELAHAVGAAFVRVTGAPAAVVGHDMRPSSPALADAFAAGAAATGADVTLIGLASTDQLYFASGHLHQAGAMFTASHNPAQYNGIKLCHADARPLSVDTGLAEIRLPDLQPGSSIMPGKVNPVVPEAVSMVCAQVVGNDAAVAWAGASGSFELNVMMPVMARNLLESIRLLAASGRLLATRCVDGLTADVPRLRTYAESSPSVVTPLTRWLGYDQAAAVVKRALADGTTIRETVLALGFVERGELTLAELDAALDVDTMTGEPPVP